jgi:hypothetical protein
MWYCFFSILRQIQNCHVFSVIKMLKPKAIIPDHTHKNQRNFPGVGL